MLADLVKAGKLPNVDQRLPKNPMVMTGYEGNGNYGGTWRRAFQGVSDINGPTKVLDRCWAWFDKNLNLIPRQLESWSVTPDAKVWTIKMRQGLKWSDGKAEYTTDDIAYWYQNAMSSVVYSALPSDHLSPSRILMVHTFPSGLTLHDSSWRGIKFKFLSNHAHARSTTLVGPLMSDTPWNARRHVPPNLPIPSYPVMTQGFLGSR